MSATLVVVKKWGKRKMRKRIRYFRYLDIWKTPSNDIFKRGSRHAARAANMHCDGE